MSKLMETPSPGKQLRIPSAKSWVAEQFLARWKLLRPAPSRAPFTGFEILLLLASVLKQFTGEQEHQPFVLHYWDLRIDNILIDKDHNIAAYQPFYIVNSLQNH